MRPAKSTTRNSSIRNPPARSWQQSDTSWETKGWFSCLYSDRASHFFRTPKAGGPVDARERTEVGRALKELGIEPIPAYSPQARGRSERNFGTWQGRLPQELRIRNIRTIEEANHFLWTYIAEFNRKFAVP